MTDPITTTSTKLAWIGVGLSTGIGVATLPTAPEVTVIASAAGTAWLILAWYASRDEQTQNHYAETHS